MSNANKYRCAAGGEWKHLNDFYKSQHKRARYNNHGNSGMVCKEHSQPVRSEITCCLCNETKPINEFSGNERRSDDPRCQRCVAWDTEQEYGVTPIPLATGHRSAEEPDPRNWVEPKLTSEFFEPKDIRGAPITGPEGLGLQRSESTDRAFSQVVGNSTRASASSETSSVVNENMSAILNHTTFPPHLRHLGEAGNHQNTRIERTTIDGDSVSESSNSAAGTRTVAKTLPPHLLHRQKPGQSSGESTTGSLSTATTLRKEREDNAASIKVEFNVWDSTGQHHRATKIPTVASSSASMASSSGMSSGLIGDWDDAPPAPMPQPESRGKGKWPKASELRFSQAELKQQQQLLGRSPYEMPEDAQRSKNRN
ncbi:hypothetical protein FLONG3_5485 [Fusarium longipes]|uniref:Stc1 domain-containing protein n=1 Tax=Fusarium longipes TaxID=694270 RepID=A0A395SUA2_9HYPO|nr:hypothetical protein FLONG3_5485 [Fusarium longipes]